MGQTKSVFKCVNCNNTSDKVEDFTVFPIDIKGKHIIDQCFQQDCFIEKIEDYKCQRCEKLGCEKETHII